MEEEVVSSQSSSSPQPKSCKDGTVAMEESKENNDTPSVGSSQEVMSERTSERPSLGSGAVQSGTAMTMIYPPRSDRIYNCQFCGKGFSTTQALGGHQNAHKQDRELEKKRREMEAEFPGLSFVDPYMDKPHLILGGYSEDALSNDNHLGVTLEPYRRRGHGVYPSFSGGLGRPMNMTVVPRIYPTRFFDGNTFTYGGSSSARELGPRPTYTPIVPRNVPPFFPPRTTNHPSSLYSQENRLREEDLTLKIGNDKVVVIDDDDDQPENPKNWGTDLSL